MAPSRPDFVSSFLLKELLLALVARVPMCDGDRCSAGNDVESLSEDTESSSALPPAHPTAPSRVVLVRRTKSSQQLVTLVDREFDIEAFIPRHLSQWLQQDRGYETIGRLRGSVVRVTKYHFATWTRCLASDKQTTLSSLALSVSAPFVTRAPVYLYVDALAIVDDNELAVKPLPRVYTHPLVAEQLQTLSDDELEKQLMIHQGLPSLQVAAVDDRFTDDHPLLEEDCVIPKEQELELEERDEWGPPVVVVQPPTDSELIEENGLVPMADSQVGHQMDQLHPTPETKALSTNVSVASRCQEQNEHGGLDAASQLDGERYPFQQENVRETFVVDSDSESNGTGDENDVATPTTSVHSMPDSHEQLDSGRKHSAALSDPSLTTSETTPDPWEILDPTDVSRERAPIPSLSLEEKTVPEQESTTACCDVVAEVGGRASPRPSPHSSPAKSHDSIGKQTPSASWATSLLRMVGLRTSSAIASPSTLSSSDDEIGTLVECDQSDAQSQEIVEFEPAEPDVPLESQATVILPYGADNDDNIHAFEYEGLLSDGVISHRPVVLRRDHRPVVGKVDETNEQRDTGNGAEGAVTSPRGLASKKDTAIVDLGPPPSAQTVTPRTVIQPEPAVPLSPTVLPRLEETIEHQERHASRCTLPSRSEDPNVVTGAAGQLEPVKSPTQLDVAVAVKSSSSRESRAGATAATSHGYKRRQQKEISFSPKGRPVSQLKMQKDDESSSRMQKRRRRNVLLTRQFEQPYVVADRVDDNYSLDGVCKLLGSGERTPNNEKEQTCVSRQPRRAWKRYENLFPPLSMTRLKEMMAEGDGNDEK